MFGGDGNDRIFGDLGNDTISGDAGDDFLAGQEDNDRLLGGDGNDSLEGNAGADVLDGGAGNDMMFGEDSVADWSSLSSAGKMAAAEGWAVAVNENDTLTGGAGNDVLVGGCGNDSLAGGTENDEVYGGSGADILQGNDGNDTLAGGTGNDTLSGGAGDDRFIFARGCGQDVVSDFTTASMDVIDLSQFGFGAPTGGALLPAGVSISTVATGTMITIGTDSILLTGVTASTLTSAEFFWV